MRASPTGACGTRSGRASSARGACSRPTAWVIGERPLPKAEFSASTNAITLARHLERRARGRAVGASDGGRVAIDLALDNIPTARAAPSSPPRPSASWNWPSAGARVRRRGGRAAPGRKTKEAAEAQRRGQGLGSTAGAATPAERRRRDPQLVGDAEGLPDAAHCAFGRPPQENGPDVAADRMAGESCRHPPSSSSASPRPARLPRRSPSAAAEHRAARSASPASPGDLPKPREAGAVRGVARRPRSSTRPGSSKRTIAV